MLHFHLKSPAGGGAVLLALLLNVWVAPRGAASLPRHHRFRGGGDGEGPPPAAAAYPPNPDMMKALEYIENLKQQRNGGGGRDDGGGGRGGGGGGGDVDYDEVDKFRVLLQLASLRDEGATDGGGGGGGDRQPQQQQPQVSAPRPDVSAEQLVKALLKTLQDQAGRTATASASAPAAEPNRNDRRAYRHRAGTAAAGTAVRPGVAGPPSEYGNFPRPHKKYPLMFEDEENRDAYRRATEDLDQQYTPQSLANLRSIFEELGRTPAAAAAAARRDLTGGDEEEEEGEEVEGAFNPRNPAYEDVAGGEDWLPMEEREETEEEEEEEEMENRSREEFARGLQAAEDASDLGDAEREESLLRRASQNQDSDPDSDDDTKLVDYYLLKVLEMSDQTQKRDRTGEQEQQEMQEQQQQKKMMKKQKRLIRPSILDPRTVKELLELSLRLHVPPQDLIDMLITEELRKLHHHRPQTAAAAAAAPYPYRSGGQAPKIRYYSRRLPLKSKTNQPAPPPEDMDREDFLDIIGVETISNEYPVVQRPAKPVSSIIDKAPVANSAPIPVPVKVSSPSGRRENLFLSELNKMPLKRQSDNGDDDDDDVEDEVTTYLAAKILTEYPNTMAKRDTLRAQRRGQGQQQLPYELYEQAVKDYLDQASDADKVSAKREAEGGEQGDGVTRQGGGEEEEAAAADAGDAEDAEMEKGTSDPLTVHEDEMQQRGKAMAGM